MNTTDTESDVKTNDNINASHVTSEPTQTISAIIRTQNALELAINELLSKSVTRSEISVQGSPEQIKECYGLKFVAPEIIQKKIHPPTTEPYLKDDVGWIIAFSFALPFIVCIIVGAFGVANIHSTPDILLYGVIGAVVGAGLGYVISKKVKQNYEQRLIAQEKSGGFVLWVTVHKAAQYDEVMQILMKYHSKNIQA